MITATDKFSWRRVLAVAGYWWPRTRIPLICFFVLSLLFSLLGLLLRNGEPLRIFVMGNGVVSLLQWMIMLAPAIFASRTGRQITYTLPAANSEKIVFQLIYSFIIVPVAVLLPMALIYYPVTGEWIFTMQLNELISYRGLTLSPGSICLMSTLNMAASIMLTLSFTVLIRKGGVLRVILLVVATTFGIGFIIGLLSSISFFKDIVMMMETDASGISEILFRVMTILTAIYTIAGITLFILYKHRFPTRQI